MKKYFVIFCNLNREKPRIYKTLNTVKKKIQLNRSLQYSVFDNEEEANNFCQPKRIKFINSSHFNPIEVEMPKKKQKIKIDQKEKDRFKIQKIKVKDIDKVYKEMLKYQNTDNFIRSRPSQKIQSNVTYYGFFDGCSKGNPGNAGIGYFLTNKEGNIIFSNSLNVGEQTNNVAEYFGLLFLLLDCVHNKVSNLKVFGDSLLVVNGIKGIFNIGNLGLKWKHLLAKQLIKEFEEFEIHHIDRNQNTTADKLSNIGVRKKTPPKEKL